MRPMSWIGSLAVLALAVAPAIAQPPPPPPPLTPLPPPPQPPGNQVTTAKANLGKVLFWDEQLSSTRTVACGSCHQPLRGGSDPRSLRTSARAINPGLDGLTGTADDIVGSPGVVLNETDHSMDWSSVFMMHEQVTGRMAPSFVNSAYAPQLFWDGRAGGTFVDPETGATVLPGGGALENQALGPPLSSAEMGNVSRAWSDVTSRLAAVAPLALAPFVPTDLLSWIDGRTYAELFTEAFGSPHLTASRMVMAVASYERTLVSTRTPFDSLIAGTATLTPQETQGFQLFGQLGCAGCHAGALMSDNQFHYIGVRPANEDIGREGVTGLPANRGEFRTPSLRNVALRPSFMHNGRFASLAEVVDFYDRGGDFNAPNKPPVIRPLGLNNGQKAALIAFLGRPLTDPRVAAQSAPFDRPALYSESGLVPQILTGGIAGSTGAPPRPIALEPPLAGNPTFTVGVEDGPVGAEAVLVVDDGEPPAGGGIPLSGSFARIATLLDDSGNGSGYGSATLAIPNDASLYGRVYYGRWYITDPAANGGVASSPSFQMQVFGPHGASQVLAVAPVSTPHAIQLYAGEPNPFLVQSTLRFDLAARSNVRLNVYDVTGRVVRNLYDRAATPAGRYTVAWDGRDDAGHDLPGGTYFYRLDTEHGSDSGRAVKLR